MQWHIHYIGRSGIASFAISALDIARIKAVRELIGPHIAFMVDANYSMENKMTRVIIIYKKTVTI